MYNLLILDDEKQERDVIKYLLKQMPHQLNIFEAPNGKEGLRILDQQTIDILITDVKMPFMTGIELAEYAKQYNQDIAIIFFSGHDDYDYLKKALLVNAITYILKPVQPEEFFDTITQTIDQLNEKRNAKLTDVEKERALQKYIIRELINGVSLAELKKQYSSADFNFLKLITHYMIYQIDELHSNKPRKIEEFIIKLGEDVDYFQYDTKSFLIYFKKSERFFEVKNKIESISGLKEYYVFDRLDSAEEFHDSFRESVKELEKKTFHQSQKNSHLQEENAPIEKDDLLISNVIKAIKIEDRSAFNKNIQKVMNYHHHNPTMSIPFIKFFYANFVEVLSKETKINWSESKEVTIQNILEANNIESILQIVESIVTIINKHLDELQMSSNLYIKNVKKFIISNYDQDLYLELLASQVALSPRYLSELFKKEEGIGINHYIKNIRMNEAKKLLITTNLKVSEIGEKVGYHNYPYFVKTFRKETGLPPEKYRQKYFNPSN